MKSGSAVNRSSPWPHGISLSPDIGFSDEELEYLASDKCGRREMYPKTQSPWLFFSTEVYGHGRAIRFVTGWPHFLPLPFAGDHGIEYANDLYEHEWNNPSHTHLTWSAWRKDAVTPKGKRVVHVTHPWVSFRRMKGLSRDPNSTGTLLFVDHSGATCETHRSASWEELLDAYRELPKKYWPTAVCLHPNDINSGLHKELRPLGLPLLTAGNGASPFFVDRYYEIVQHYEFGSSSGIGTQMFICEEFGLRYFLLGKPATWGPKPLNSKGEAEQRDALKMRPQTGPRTEAFDKAFREFPPRASKKKAAIVSEALGLEGARGDIRLFTKTALLGESILVTPRMLKKILTLLFKKKAPNLSS